MDLLTFAANAIFSTESKEDTIIPVTPTKGARPVFGEVTNTIGISPEKFSNSPLRALFMSPTLNTPTTKLRSLASAVLIPGSRSIIGRGNNGKSLSYPSPEVQTPNGEGMSPHVSNGGLGKSPLTPMSNLKLLTRIASMEESLTSKKVLFQSINDQKVQCSSNVDSLLTSSSTAQTIPNFQHHSSECLHQSNNQSNTSTSTHLKHTTSSYYLTPSSPGCLVTGNLGNLSSVDEISSNRSSEGSRKDKSLGLLSEKFLEHFPMEVSFLETPRRLVIDEVASMLGTERRRVYDIINVLESLSMAARVQKNMYQWMGKLHLEETLSRLKALGLKLGMGLHLQQQHLDNDFKLPTNVNANGDGDKIDSRREKSLGILCQKFLMLLLVSPEPHVISLDNAVRKLVGEVGEDGERLRTRGRRLYDIANVLTSLGLVKRVPTAKAFQYVGPEVTAAASEDVSLGVLHRHSLLPSRLGSSGGKENISLGDHDVTPSNITPPVQKRGRPRKLSSDFSASTLPVAKRSKIQRTRSEDINTSKPTRKFTRHPSLHDICQVAEVEREKLIQEEQLQQSHSNREMILNPSSYMSSLEKVCKTKKAATKSGSEALRSRDASVTSLQRRLTSRTKIPAALTFQGTCGTSKNKGQISAQPEIEQELTKQSGVTGQDAEHHIPISSHHNFEGCKVSEDDARKTIFSTGTWQNKFCSNSQNLKASPKVMVTGRCSPQSGLQSSSHGTPHTPNASKSMQVIKVITRTGISNQHNSSTVITVLPVAQNCNQSSAPPNLITNVNGGFHHMSTGTYTNGQKVVGSNDSVTERVAVSDSRESMCNPYAVYTVSNNHIGQRTFGRVSSSKTTTAYSSKNGKTFCDNSPPSHSSQPSVVGMGTNIPLGPVQHQLNISAGQKSSDGCDQNSWWQPSPDASSTDSELEEIFGNSFNFTRPKNLVGGVVSHERDGTNEHFENIKKFTQKIFPKPVFLKESEKLNNFSPEDKTVPSLLVKPKDKPFIVPAGTCDMEPLYYINNASSTLELTSPSLAENSRPFKLYHYDPFTKLLTPVDTYNVALDTQSQCRNDFVAYNTMPEYLKHSVAYGTTLNILPPCWKHTVAYSTALDTQCQKDALAYCTTLAMLPQYQKDPVAYSMALDTHPWCPKVSVPYNSSYVGNEPNENCCDDGPRIVFAGTGLKSYIDESASWLLLPKCSSSKVHITHHSLPELAPPNSLTPC